MRAQALIHSVGEFVAWGGNKHSLCVGASLYAVIKSLAGAARHGCW